MTATKRDANGGRICPTCGDVVGITLGQQRRHDAQKHAKRTPADLVVGQVYSAADIAEMFGLTEARVKKGGIIPVPMKRGH